MPDFLFSVFRFLSYSSPTLAYLPPSLRNHLLQLKSRTFIVGFRVFVLQLIYCNEGYLLSPTFLHCLCKLMLERKQQLLFFPCKNPQEYLMAEFFFFCNQSLGNQSPEMKPIGLLARRNFCPQVFRGYIFRVYFMICRQVI